MSRLYSCQPFVTPEEVYADDAAHDLDENDDTPLLLEAIDAASDMLTKASGFEVHGVCERTVRPMGWSVTGMSESRTDYLGLDVIPLRGPDPQVIEVMIDGIVLGQNEYGLIDNSMLFRRTGGDWPRNNSLSKLPYEVGVFQIVYRFGRPFDFVTKQAGIELAVKLTRDAKSERRGIALPGIRQMTLQGVTVSTRDAAVSGGAEDPNVGLEGMENLPRVARFVAMYGDRRGLESVVWSPELDHGWRLYEVEGPSGS
jgi:hypothetical protein